MIRETERRLGKAVVVRLYTMMPEHTILLAEVPKADSRYPEIITTRLAILVAKDDKIELLAGLNEYSEDYDEDVDNLKKVVEEISSDIKERVEKAASES